MRSDSVSLLVVYYSYIKTIPFIPKRSNLNHKNALGYVVYRLFLSDHTTLGLWRRVHQKEEAETSRDIKGGISFEMKEEYATDPWGLVWSTEEHNNSEMCFISYS